MLARLKTALLSGAVALAVTSSSLVALTGAEEKPPLTASVPLHAHLLQRCWRVQGPVANMLKLLPPATCPQRLPRTRMACTGAAQARGDTLLYIQIQSSPRSDEYS